jgi:hypothetical protein
MGFELEHNYDSHRLDDRTRSDYGSENLVQFTSEFSECVYFSFSGLINKGIICT